MTAAAKAGSQSAPCAGRPRWRLTWTRDEDALRRVVAYSNESPCLNFPRKPVVASRRANGGLHYPRSLSHFLGTAHGDHCLDPPPLHGGNPLGHPCQRPTSSWCTSSWRTPTASGAASGRIGTMERALTGPSVAVLCPVDDPVPVAPVRGCGYRVPRRDRGREAPYGR
jgi:hypothetical protein